MKDHSYGVDACIYLPGNELTSKRKYRVGLPNAIRPRSPTEYGPWKSHATPFEVAMPMWPMKGSIHVMGGNGDQRMVNANGWSMEHDDGDSSFVRAIDDMIYE